MKRNLFLSLVVTVFTLVSTCFGLSQEAKDKGFVYLHDIDPTIQTSLRYFSNENFVGERVEGYKKNVVIMTKQAAEALKKVQAAVGKDGYSLVVYDAYRPQRGVNHFMKWSKNSSQAKKVGYYPRVDKTRVFELGYVAEKSGHSRGSTVDLTLIKKGHKLYPVKEIKRKLLDGFEITVLDDGTVDMGSHFDLFDLASHHENKLIDLKFKKLRAYLRAKMEEHGFKIINEEWWHFTLKNEPYPLTRDTSYFDFVVE